LTGPWLGDDKSVTPHRGPVAGAPPGL